MNEPAADRLQSVFFEAMGRPPEDRTRFVRQTCGDDATLCDSVLSLLQSHDSAEDFLEAAPISLTSLAGSEETVREEDEELVGSTFGAYTIERHLGSGGMGTVFLAEQRRDQLARRVALKVVRRGRNTQEIVERFHRERQALAALDHPGIARFIDGGTLPDGRPFLVMDYIEGQPLFEYCDSRRLGIDARVGLFLEICEAVQYSHRHLVIHRDLKPGNVLVTADGRPKLLDFGIAKVLAPTEAETSAPTTDAHYQFFTLEYASPEQLRGDRISTASDVYSLGLILYELLTGQRPRRSTSRTPVRVLDDLERKPPARPSSAAASTDAVRSQFLGPGPQRLRRRLQGDLDAIVLKILRVEPNERYASADELATDLRRYLAALPVAARRGTWRYRTQRFIRRHRAVVVVSFLLAMALVAGVATTTWQAKEARRQARAAQETRGFLVDLYGSTAPDGVESSREQVERTLRQEEVDRLSRSLALDPVEQLEFARAIARIADRHHLRELSGHWWTRAVEAAEVIDDSDLEEKVLVEAARAAFDGHAYRRAIALLERAVALERDQNSFAKALSTRSRWRLGIGDGQEDVELAGLPMEERWALVVDRAELLRDLGRAEDALACLEPIVFEASESRVDPRLQAKLLAAFAGVLWESPRFGQAELVYRRAYELLWGRDDADDGALLELKARIATCVEHRDRSPVAMFADWPRLKNLRMSWVRRWREALVEAYGSGSVEEARVQLLISTRVNPLEGEHLARSAQQALARRLGPDHPEVGEALLRLAEYLARPADSDETEEQCEARLRKSEAILAQAEEILEGRLRRRAHHRAQAAMVRGLVGVHRLEDDLARASFARAQRAWEEVLGSNHPLVTGPARVVSSDLVPDGSQDPTDVLEHPSPWSGGTVDPDHDWESESTTSLDFDDDYVEKVVVVGEGRWQRAVLWVLGSAYNFGHEVFRREAPYTIEFNGDSSKRLVFYVGSRFLTTDDDLDWVPFEIPIGWLTRGDNTVALFEGPYDEWRQTYPYPWEFNNLRLAVDRDHDEDHSWWFGNGQYCCEDVRGLAADYPFRKPDGPGLAAHRMQGRQETRGELMMFLELVPSR